MLDSPVEVLAVLLAVCALYFYVAESSGSRVFVYLPPLIWIYATPVVLNNTGVIPDRSPVYDQLGELALPVFIVLMLLKVDVAATVRIMGKGVLVMLCGTAGVAVGAVVAYLAVRSQMDPDAWKGYLALSGSWIGGTGNMASVREAVGTPPAQFGLAVVADNLVYVVWLPLLLASKGFAERFNRWAKVDPDRLRQMESAAGDALEAAREMRMPDLLYLGAIATATVMLATWLAPLMPSGGDAFSAGTWKILIVTTLALLLSTTAARRLPGSQRIATAIIYLFVASMGARASLEGFGDALPFVGGAFIWIAIHGLFCIAAARLFRVDVHSLAIASAANVGGAASAPVVAAHHRPSLVPAAVLMALIGYALGNYVPLLVLQPILQALAPA